MAQQLIRADPPVSFAVGRHYASWLQMFRLFLLSHDALEHLEFLEAVDELRVWEPHTTMTRRIYDRYVRADGDRGPTALPVSAAVRQALTEAFSTLPPPEGAAVFEAAYQEVVDRVNEGSYRDFQQMAEEARHSG